MSGFPLSQSQAVSTTLPFSYRTFRLPLFFSIQLSVNVTRSEFFLHNINMAAPPPAADPTMPPGMDPLAADPLGGKDPMAAGSLDADPLGGIPPMPGDPSMGAGDPSRMPYSESIVSCISWHAKFGWR